MEGVYELSYAQGWLVGEREMVSEATWRWEQDCPSRGAAIPSPPCVLRVGAWQGCRLKFWLSLSRAARAREEECFNCAPPLHQPLRPGARDEAEHPQRLLPGCVSTSSPLGLTLNLRMAGVPALLQQPRPLTWVAQRRTSIVATRPGQDQGASSRQQQ